ncbi:hypothetical protein AAY72_01715 [Alishewanella sp. WH16-1]|uniref:hypothetical protein n=1 Tax=Alishewanella sp. WH16-1 TaxID=1651088 RepID=UPI00070AABCF|nr:hypothetical protein [Alishewanella sp. WH16-1]KRS22852.1 hypothetical protein AAY72_01715 [Alishewanella sp. WH16-1]
MNKETIKELALANGFKLKEQPDGTMDLNPYAFEFAAALERVATAELKVQVEQLLKPAKEAAEALGFASHHLRGRVSEKMLMDMAEKADALIGAIGSTPAQCLSEHDAVVGRKAFIAGVNATGQGYNGELGLSDDEIIDLAELYVSRKIRQQAKGE